MYEPLAGTIAHRLTTDLATSALPDAPVVDEPEPAARRRSVAPSLRQRSARLLVNLAARLDPATPKPAVLSTARSRPAR
jgi:hypothetical protein